MVCPAALYLNGLDLQLVFPSMLSPSHYCGEAGIWFLANRYRLWRRLGSAPLPGSWGLSEDESVVDECAESNHAYTTWGTDFSFRERRSWSQSGDAIWAEVGGMHKNVVGNLSRPGQVVLDLFQRSFSTAKAFIGLPRHLRSMRCGIDTDCYNQS